MDSIKLAKNLVLWPVERLKPYNKNARTHSHEQVDQIAASIAEFGFTNPILVDTEDGIIAGHGRLMAAQKLGLSEVPVVVLDHLSDAQRRAYIIADNKLALNAGWDDDMLAEELCALYAEGFDLGLTGFSDDELAGLLPEVEKLDPQSDEDEVPDALPNPKVVRGEVYILGKHRLMCGDSTVIADVERLMDGKKADMAFTDPPYALFGNSTGVSGVADDKMIRPFFRDVLGNLKISVKKYAHLYVCCDWHSAFVIEGISRDIELTSKNLIVWDKGDGGVGNMFQNCHELIWFFTNTPKQKTTQKLESGERVVNGVSNIFRFKRVHSGDRFHNAQKPVEMIALAITSGSDPGDIVIDLFGGSGSTLIAAESVQRKSNIMEIEPNYCGVILDRWQSYTGKKAYREDGKSWDEIKAQ